MYTNGTTTISGKRIEVDGRVILNPTPEMLADAGWQKVEPTQPSESELAAQARAAEVEELEDATRRERLQGDKDCRACGLPLPYDAEASHSERQAIRDRINELEDEP